MSVGDKFVVTGRGGAGNIGSPELKPVDSGKDDFKTPTLKSNMYTTGRGGTGNMAKNDKGAEARKAQDVEPVVHREGTSRVQVSTGRGGGGNMFKEKTAKAVTDSGRGRDKPRQGSSVSELGRQMLQRIRSNSSRRRSPESGSARSSVSSDRPNPGS